MPPKPSTSSTSSYKKRRAEFEEQTSINDFFHKLPLAKKQPIKANTRGRYSTGTLQDPPTTSGVKRPPRAKRKPEFVDLTHSQPAQDDAKQHAENRPDPIDTNQNGGVSEEPLNSTPSDATRANGHDKGKGKIVCEADDVEMFEFDTPRDRARLMAPPSSVTLVPMSCATSRFELSSPLSSPEYPDLPIERARSHSKLDPFLDSIFSTEGAPMPHNFSEVIPSSQTQEREYSPPRPIAFTSIQSSTYPQAPTSSSFPRLFYRTTSFEGDVVPDSQPSSPVKLHTSPVRSLTRDRLRSSSDEQPILTAHQQSQHTSEKEESTQSEDSQIVVPTSWTAPLLEMAGVHNHPFQPHLETPVHTEVGTNAFHPITIDEDLEVIPSSQSQYMSPPPKYSSSHPNPPPITSTIEPQSGTKESSPLKLSRMSYGSQVVTPVKTGTFSTAGQRIFVSPSKAIVFISSSPSKPNLSQDAKFSLPPNSRLRLSSSDLAYPNSSPVRGDSGTSSLLSQTQDDVYEPWMQDLVSAQGRNIRRGSDPSPTQTQTTQQESLQPWMRSLIRRDEEAKVTTDARSDQGFSQSTKLFLGSPLEDDGAEEGYMGANTTIRDAIVSKRTSMPPPLPPSMSKSGPPLRTASIETNNVPIDKLARFKPPTTPKKPPRSLNLQQHQTPQRKLFISPRVPLSPNHALPSLSSADLLSLPKLPGEDEVSIDDISSQFSILSEGPDFAPLEEEMFQGLFETQASETGIS